MSFGGGGAAGTLAPVAYLQAVHSDWMTHGDNGATPPVPIDTIDKSIVDLVNDLTSGHLVNVGPEDILNLTHPGGWVYIGWTYSDALDQMTHNTGNTSALTLSHPYINLIEGTVYYVRVLQGSGSTAGTAAITLGSGGESVTMTGADGAEYYYGNFTYTTQATFAITPTTTYDGQVISVEIMVVTGNPYLDIEAYDPDTEIGNMLANVNAIEAHVNGILPESIWDSLVDKVSDKKSTIFADNDIDSRVSTIQTAVDTESDAILADAATNIISALDGTDKLLDKSYTQASGDMSTEVDSIINKSLTNAQSALVQAAIESIGRARTAMQDVQSEANTNMDDIVGDAVDKALTKVSGSSGNLIDNAYDKVSSEVATEITKQIGLALQYSSLLSNDSYTLAKTNTGDLADTAHSKALINISALIDEATNKVEGKLERVISGGGGLIESKVVSIVTSAINTALANTNTSVISDAVNAFETKKLPAYMRSMNRFAGGMADINAVNSSAYIMGLALLEGEFQNGITEYSANLNLETYKETTKQFMDAFRTFLSDYMNAYVGSMANYTGGYTNSTGGFNAGIFEMIKNQIGSFHQISGGYGDEFKHSLSEYIGAHIPVMSEYLNSYRSYIGTHAKEITDHLTGHLQSWNTAFGGRNDSFKTALVEYLRSHMTGAGYYTDIYKSVFGQHLGSQMEVDNRLLTARAGLVNSSSDQMVRMFMAKHGLKDSFYRAKDVYYKSKVTLEKEELDRNIELDYLDATWDLSLFQVAGGLLSAVAGGAGYVPNKPTTQKSAASAAIQMAVAGAAAGTGAGGPGIGTLVGAGIGAALGGIGGALSEG